MSRRTRCPVICISGIDGCGKTSIIEGVRRELEADGLPTRYVWLRYNHYLTKVLLAFCRAVGLTRYEYPDGVRVGYHDFYKSRLVSWLFVIFTYVDTLLVSVVLVYLPALLGSRALICDRYILDIMIDLEIDTRIRFSSGGRLERLFRGLMPAGSQCYLIMRDQAAVLQCRPENVRDRNFQRRWELYEEYAVHPWVELIENTSTIENAVTQVVRRTKSDRS